jgi:hypothetical protein
VFGFGAKDIAEVPVPGEGTVMLPAGKKVKLRYVEDREGRHVDATSGKTWAGPHADLAVTVTPAAGGPALELKKPRMISAGSGSGKIYKDLGSVELSADTECTVAASMTVSDDHVSPRVVVRA